MPVWVRVVGRLKPNVPFNRAKAEMQGIFERIVRSYPKGFLHMYREETIRYFRFMLLTERLVGGSRLRADGPVRRGGLRFADRHFEYCEPAAGAEFDAAARTGDTHVTGCRADADSQAVPG